MTEKRAVGW